MAGYTHSYGSGKSDLWMLRLDTDGDERWRDYEGGTENDWANDLLETDQGNLLLVGAKINAQSKHRQAWILLTNRVGNFLWSHELNNNDERELKSVIQLRSGDFAAVGLIRSQPKAAADAWVICFNKSGDILWEKIIGGYGQQQANSLAETPEGNMLVAGYQQSDTVNKADVLLAMISRTGEEIWRKKWGKSGNEVANKVLISREGEMTVVGWTSSEGNGSLDGLIIRLQTDGTEKWHQTYGGAGKDAFYGACFTPEGGVVATGQYQPVGSPDPACWLVNADQLGKPRWSSFFNGDLAAIGKSVVADANGWAVAGEGRKKGKDDFDYMLQRVDFRGKGTGWLSTQVAPGVTKLPPRPVVSANALPALWVTTVGVSEFQESAYNLKYANQDAFALKFEFDNMAPGMFREVNTLCLADDQASRARVTYVLDSIAALVQPQDLWVIYFSTHGVLDDLGNLVLLPHDFDPNHPEETGWQFADLSLTWGKAPARKLVLLDACHSGGSSQNWLSASLANPASLNAAATTAAVKDGRITVMTSSSSEEYSYEQSAWGHSAFGLALVEALRGGADYNGDRKISLYEMNLYVIERVQALTQGRQHPYTPINLFGNIPIYQMR